MVPTYSCLQKVDVEFGSHALANLTFHMTTIFFVLPDINECDIISNEAVEVDYPSYSLQSSNGEDPAEVLANKYPPGYPCVTPARCVNTQGSFTCRCNGNNQCNSGEYQAKRTVLIMGDT